MAEATRREFTGLLLSATTPSRMTAWDFRFPALEGGEHDLSAWRGRVLLVVNTASFCGFTPQYRALQGLHERFASAGLVVFGVPSDDFNQESRDQRRIREFCDVEFGITFPMAGLCRVRGENAHPFYRWVAAQVGGPRWNFHKYLVGRSGRDVKGFPSRVEPNSPILLGAIDAALGEPAA